MRTRASKIRLVVVVHDSVHPPPLMPRWATVLRFVIPTGAYPDFLLRGPHQRPRVRLSVRESRMRLANATKFDRKSGVAQWRDLRFALMEKRNPETIRPRRIRLCPKVEPQVPPLRYAPVGMTNFRAVAHLGMSGGGWTESKKLIWTRLAESSPGRTRISCAAWWIQRTSCGFPLRKPHTQTLQAGGVGKSELYMSTATFQGPSPFFLNISSSLPWSVAALPWASLAVKV